MASAKAAYGVDDVAGVAAAAAAASRVRAFEPLRRIPSLNMQSRMRITTRVHPKKRDSLNHSRARKPARSAKESPAKGDAADGAAGAAVVATGSATERRRSRAAMADQNRNCDTRSKIWTARRVRKAHRPMCRRRQRSALLYRRLKHRRLLLAHKSRRAVARPFVSPRRSPPTARRYRLRTFQRQRR